MKILKIFKYSEFVVTITKVGGGYGYIASKGAITMKDPNPGYSETPFPTLINAEEAAKGAIFVHDVMAMFTKLPARDQGHIAMLIKRVYDGDWELEYGPDPGPPEQ
jgi:hypothetical protein